MMHFAAAMRLRKSLIAAAFIAHIRSADGLLTALVIESREGGLLVALPDGLARIDRGPANGAQRRWEGGSITAAPGSLAPPEPTLTMHSSASVALICFSGNDGRRSPQQLRRHQKNSPGQHGGAGARKPLRPKG
jgi:hypothetical protein